MHLLVPVHVAATYVRAGRLLRDLGDDGSNGAHNYEMIVEMLETLKEELEVAAIYQRIEKLRLGDRLKVRWNVDSLPMRARIPSLTIQPLLENAIYHGIEMLPDGGEVIVTGKVDGDKLDITMTNPKASDATQRKGGNQMAMTNIRQRFELAYGTRASVDVTNSNEEFRVRMIFPLEERSGERA